MRLRAMGMTSHGNFGAMMPPSCMAARSIADRNAGAFVPLVIAASWLAAVPLSSGRATWSTNAMV